MPNFFGNRSNFVLFFLFGLIGFVFFNSFFKTTQTNEHTSLKQAEEISFALFSKPEKLNLSSADISVNKVLFPMHMGLLTHNYKGELYSGVAKSWQVSANKLDYVFELDADLVFHNGKKMTCEDVQYSFSNILSGEIKTALADMIATVECLDVYRFQIHLYYSSSLFLPLLTHDVASVIPRGEDPQNALIGIGPYQLKKLTEDYVLLESVDHHPKLKPWSAKKIRFRIYKSVSEAIEAFDHHGIDIVDLSGFPTVNPKNKTSTSLYPIRLWVLTFGELFDTDSFAKISCINKQINRQNLAGKLNELTPEIFSPAYGLVRPHSPGYFESESSLGKNISCFPSNTIYRVIAIQGLVRDDLIDEIKSNLTLLGLQADFSFLTKGEFIQRLSDRNYEVALFSMNVSHESEQNLNKVYGEKPFLPFAQHSDSLIREVRDLEKVYSKSLRANKIYAFEQKMFENPVLAPLLFQKSSYLVYDCLSTENVTMTSDFEKLQEVGLINGCE